MLDRKIKHSEIDGEGSKTLDAMNYEKEPQKHLWGVYK